MVSKKQRALLNAKVARAWPKGSGKGDSLAYTITLGASFGRVNGPTSSKKQSAKGCKRFASN